MAKKQKRQPLTYLYLLDQLLFIKDRAEKIGMGQEQMKQLKFIRQDAFGKITEVELFDLNLVRLDKDKVVIKIFEK